MTDQPRSRVFLWVLLGGGAFFLFLVAIFALVYFTVRSQQKDSFSGFGDKIGVVDLEGVILTPKDVVEQLQKVRRRQFHQGHHHACEFARRRSRGFGRDLSRGAAHSRPEEEAASSHPSKPWAPAVPTYVSSATNKIFADDASIVGSIGVIAEWYNYEELMKWAKLQQITLKAGEFKDTGSPTRPMTPEERAYMQGLIDNMHTQFIHSVAVGRKMKDDEVRALANGKVWTGEQAMPLKLIDQIGDFRAAIDDTAKSVGIKGEPTLVHPEKDRKSVLDLLFGDVSEYLPNRAKLMETNVGFYYLMEVVRRTGKLRNSASSTKLILANTGSNLRVSVVLKVSDGLRIGLMRSASRRGACEMTKADLIDEVSRLTELTRKDSEVIVETIFESVVRSLRAGDKIEIRGFGSFRTRQRKPRVGRNPKTGDRVEVPAKKIPFFKPSKELKDMVNNYVEEPSAGTGSSRSASEWQWGWEL